MSLENKPTFEEIIKRSTKLIQEVMGGDMENLKSKLIEIIIPKETVTTYIGQTMAVMACNLLARTVKRLCITIECDGPLVGGIPILFDNINSTLGFYLNELVEYINPNVILEKEPTDAYLALVIGEKLSEDMKLGSCSPESIREKKHIFISARGWVGYCVLSPEILPSVLPDDNNPIGALFAAIMGCMEIIKILLKWKYLDKYRNESRPIVFSAYDVKWHHDINCSIGPQIPNNIDFGKVSFAGLGAVGSCAIYAFAHFNQKQFTGEFYLCDIDYLDKSNLNRNLTVGWRSVGMAKSLVNHEFLKMNMGHNDKLQFWPCLDYFSSMSMVFGQNDIPCVLESTDSRKLKRTISMYYPNPQILISGGTHEFTPQVSVHRQLEGACLACMSGSEMKAQDYVNIIKNNMQKKGQVFSDNEILVMAENKRQQLGEKAFGFGINQLLIAIAQEFGIIESVGGYEGYPGLSKVTRQLFDTEVGEEWPTIGPVSAFPAVLMIVELIKLKCYPDRVLNNLFIIDLLYSHINQIPQTLPQVENCDCVKFRLELDLLKQYNQDLMNKNHK